MFESLEARRLFTITLDNGVLTIVGTQDADNIYVQSSAGATTGNSDSNMLATVVNGNQQVFNFPDVHSIVIQGLGGDDTITTSDSYQTGAFHPIGSGIYEAHHIAIPTTVSGGGGDDLIFANGNPFPAAFVIPVTDVSPANQIIIGGNGNDTIIGGAGDDLISGGAGRDKLDGADGNDTILGGQNNDGLHGGLGADVIFGGGGLDTVDYSDRTDHLDISLDDIDNDGDAPPIGSELPIRSIEDDNVHSDVEIVIGGEGPDQIEGDGANNTLLGLGGNDTLHGAAGADWLYGGKGKDQLFGETGNDSLFGSEGVPDKYIQQHDTLDGGAGTDHSDDFPSDLQRHIEGTIFID